MVNDAGAALERYEYDGYGKRTVLDVDFVAKSSFGGYTNVGFTGQRIDILDDGNLTMNYYKNRWYDAETGRFMSHDPLGIVPEGYYFPIVQNIDGSNYFQFVKANPMAYIDRYGFAAGFYASDPHTGLIVEVKNSDGETCGYLHADYYRYGYGTNLDLHNPIGGILEADGMAVYCKIRNFINEWSPIGPGMVDIEFSTTDKNIEFKIDDGDDKAMIDFILDTAGFDKEWLNNLCCKKQNSGINKRAARNGFSIYNYATNNCNNYTICGMNALTGGEWHKNSWADFGVTSNDLENWYNNVKPQDCGYNISHTGFH